MSSDENEETNPIVNNFNIDVILGELGEFGRYQMLILFLISITVFVISPDSLVFVFTTTDIDYRCKVPDCDLENATFNSDASFLNFTIPHDGNGWSKCKRYQIINLSTIENKSDICDSDHFNQSVEIECNEFLYTNGETTIISEWDLNCKNEWKSTLVGSLYEAGLFIGLPISGLISDKYGRRNIFIITSVVLALFGIIQSYSFNYPMYLTLELIKSVVGSAIFSIGFILCMEMIGPKYRVLVGVLINCFYALGQAYLGVLAYWFRTWHQLLLVVYCLSLLTFCNFWFLPESIRWLVTKGRLREAAKLVKKSAKINKITFSENVEKMLEASKIKCYRFENRSNKKAVEAENSDNNHSIKLLLKAFKSRTILFRILNCTFCWMANLFIYYGLNIYSISVAGDKYVNFILVCLIEIPASIMWYLTERIGRKRTQSGSLIISGVACLVALCLSDDTPFGYELAFFLFSKFAITISFNTLYVYTVEIFPTEIRNSLLVTCSMFGRIGSILAPQIPLLAKYMESLPMILFASLAISSGLLVLQLPETLNKRLPDTIKEAENL